MTDSADAQWWRPFADAIAAMPGPRRPAALLGLAQTLADRGDKRAASLHALAALRGAAGQADRQTEGEARRLLYRFVPSYHAQVATDPVRLAAWDAALRAVVRPGMRALEIGTGCGILAMLAARAGAYVTTCEKDPVLAAIAEETIRLNGLESRIRVIAKPADALRIPDDLDGPADLLLFDVFADNLFGFQPFRLARSVGHLLAPDAAVVPRGAALMGALACVDDLGRIVPERAAGFDVSPLRAAAPLHVTLGGFGPPAQLRSAGAVLVSADLPGDMPANAGIVRSAHHSDGGLVNGVAVWLRLDLSDGQALEARPGLHAPGFYARAHFHPFGAEVETRRGDTIAVEAAWQGRHLTVRAVSG